MINDVLKQILNKIEAAKKIFIFGHIRPDGDCYGSQFGLCALLKENYPDKEVHVVGDRANYVAFLGEPEKENIKDQEIQGALAIVVDCGNGARVSDLRYKLADCVIKIDHHIIEDQYGDLNYVEEQSPACCQILAKLAVEWGWRFNHAAAEALYTGIVTDTGRFRFRGVNSGTFVVASTLLDYGVEVDKLDTLLSVETMNVIKLKGYVLENCEFTNHGVVYIRMTREVVEKYGVSDEDAAAQVSLIGTIEGYPIYCLFMEYPNEIRIRFRSRGPRVDKVANRYGGGGHEKAAGGTLKSWEDLDLVLKDLNDLNDYYNKTGEENLF